MPQSSNWASNNGTRGSRGDCGSAKISETFQTILGYVEDKIVHSSYCMIGT